MYACVCVRVNICVRKGRPKGQKEKVQTDCINCPHTVTYITQVHIPTKYTTVFRMYVRPSSSRSFLFYFYVRHTDPQRGGAEGGGNFQDRRNLIVSDRREFCSLVTI